MKRNRGRLKIRIKYCGGCNPGYDRLALVKRIEERLRGKVALVGAEGDGISLVLAVEGCGIACADLSDFAGLEVRVITCPEDAELFIRDLEATTS
ncbi:MAG: hypothetical protein MUO24_11725 [Desulfobacterales bacterium]|nr:hypothetical protein [Desulfobacterales bacterium]